MPAVEYFLKVDGIPGDSADAAHSGEIEAESFGWGETHAGTTQGAGPGLPAGRTQVQDLNVTMQMSKASPLLMQACATGRRIGTVTLTVRKTGQQPVDFFVVKLSDVVITSYHTGGSAHADLPLDQIAFGFAKIELEFRPQRPDGSFDQSVRASWDVRSMRP
jgi:type VI secretion system secreted protein Hcp